MAETAKRGRDGWGLYLAALVCLIPIVVPSGPARLAIVDGLIVLGLGIFAVRTLMRHETVRVPFMGPVFIISVGSMAAVTNALSPRASFLAMAQDAYLFLWFLMLVHLLKDRDLTFLQKTWMWVGNAIALYGLGILVVESHLSLLDMVKPRGRRAYGTFYDPNMFAGYLVMSLFFVLSLGRRIPRLLRWSSIVLLVVGIIATKSNGGALSLMIGLPVWLLMRARTRKVHPMAIASGALLGGCLLLVAVWLVAGLGLGSSQISAFESNSFLARASHSSEGRFTIWKNLQSTYAKSPLGIGPGNSSSLTFAVRDRLRPNSLQAKEAHNDYLAYAIERGPLGILGLLLLLASAFGKLIRALAPREGKGAPDEATAALVAAAAGALAASIVHGLTIEVLHFRHFWMLLAIVCAIDLRLKSARAESRATAQSPLSGVPASVAAA